jgi:hypothetical protein
MKWMEVLGLVCLRGVSIVVSQCRSVAFFVFQFHSFAKSSIQSFIYLSIFVSLLFNFGILSFSALSSFCKRQNPGRG